MPNYVPCLTGDDQVIHLSAAGSPGATLCAKASTGRTVRMGGAQICVPCAKRLLGSIFEDAGADGVASVEVIVTPQSAPPPPQL